jgi:PAS domain S-box-containing protein
MRAFAQSIVETVRHPLVVLDGRLRVRRANAAFYRVFGGTSAETEGRPLFEVGSGPWDIPRLRALLEDVIGRGEPFEDFEVRPDLPHLGRKVMLLNARRVQSDEDGAALVLLAIEDVTDRVQAREELQRLNRDLEERVRARTARDALLLANVRDSVIVTDLDGVITFWNEGATKLFGWTAEEMLGRPLIERVPPEGRPEMAAAFRAMAGRQDFAGEWQDYRKDGSRVWIAARVSLLRGPDGRPAGIMRVSHDITERKRAEAERDEILARLRMQIDRMPLAYILHDVDYRIIEWNAAAERIFGYRKEEVLGMGPPFAKLVPAGTLPHTDAIIRRLRRGDMTAHSVNDNLTKDGRTITCEWYNTPLLDANGCFQGVLALALDITEKRSLEEQLRQSQKLEAIGQLAGGVAHDFNNLLTVITGYGELVLSSLPTGHPARELVGEMTKAGERAAGLTRQLLAFSRKAMLAPRVLDLNTVIIEIEKMLRRVIGEDVALSIRLQPGLGLVRADPGHLEQMILNLCVNARDAMPRGGRLTIETRNVAADETRRAPQVLLAVSDTGCGIPAEILPRIFEPFFTTKEHGKGTGLGLATVHGIVHQSEGRIEVSSEVGRGTTFRIYLPRVEGATSTGKSLPGVRVMPRGSETVLLVEDDDAVRALSRHVLAGCGYVILEAVDGEEAVRVCGRHAAPIHLLATDVVMPGLGGRALAQRLLELHPEMKVVYLSGYTDDAVVRHGILEEQVHFLQKPFSPLALAHKVREVLDVQ